MSKEKTIDVIKNEKMVAVVRNVSNDKILDTCKALLDGGVKCIEVTFNQANPTGNQDTHDAIKMINEKFGDDILVGAGTVMTVEQIELAIAAGAKYIISPNYDKEIVETTNKLGAVSIPGVLTPSEIADAHKAGAHFMKVFPSGVLGIDYIKAIKAPLNHIPLIVVGGVNLDNINEFIDIDVAGFGMGSNLVNTALINAGKYDELTRLAQSYVDAVKGA